MNLTFNYSELSHKGNVRAQNEDTSGVLKTKNGQVFVLCDGMGGAVGGKMASSIAVKSILEYFEREVYSDKTEALHAAIRFANEQIYATTLEKPELKGMGTTCCVVLVDGLDIFAAHVGDSRVYLMNDDGLFHLTRDHSFVMQLLEQGTISLEDAWKHPKRSRILKALGNEATISATVTSQPIHLKKGDKLLLCSDGLNDMVPDHEIYAILNRSEAELDERTHKLVEAALKYGGKDNVTVQTIEITESPFQKSTFIDRTFRETSTASTIPPVDATTGERHKSGGFSPLLRYGIIASSVLILGVALYFLLPKINEFLKERGQDVATVVDKNPTTDMEETGEKPTVPSEEIDLNSLDEKERKAYEELLESKTVKSCVEFVKEYPKSVLLQKVDAIAYDRVINNQTGIDNKYSASKMYYQSPGLKGYNFEVAEFAFSAVKGSKRYLKKFINDFDDLRGLAQSELDKLERKNKPVAKTPKSTKKPDTAPPAPAPAERKYVLINTEKGFPNAWSVREKYCKEIGKEEFKSWNTHLDDIGVVKDGDKIYYEPPVSKKKINEESSVSINLEQVKVSLVLKQNNNLDILNCAFKLPANRMIITDNGNEKIAQFKESKEISFNDLPPDIQNLIINGMLPPNRTLNLSDCNALFSQ